MGNPYYGAAMWSGIGSGLQQALGQIAQAFTMKHAEEMKAWEDSRAVYGAMLGMADPEMKAIGLTGLMQEKPKKGMFAHIEKDPNLAQARVLIQKALAGADTAPTPPPTQDLTPPPPVLPQQSAAMPATDGSSDAPPIDPSAAVGGAPQIPGNAPIQTMVTPGGAPPSAPPPPEGQGVQAGTPATAPAPTMPGPPPPVAGVPGAKDVPEFGTHPYETAVGLANVNLAQTRKQILAANPMMSDTQFATEMKPYVEGHAKFVNLLQQAKALGMPYEQAAPAIYQQMAPVAAQIEGKKDVAKTVADAKIQAADKMVNLKKDLESGKYQQQRLMEDVKFAHSSALKQLGASIGDAKVRLVEMPDPTDETGMSTVKVPVTEGDLKSMAGKGEFFQGKVPSAVMPRLTSAYAAQRRIEEIQRDLPEIIQHVGPVAGRGSEALKALGTQDPIVQKFLTDRAQVAAYLTSVHAARGKAFLDSMEAATGSLTDNPAALKMALDETHAGTQEFIQTMRPGTRKPAGATVPAGGPPAAPPSLATPGAPSAPPGVSAKPPKNPKPGDVWMSPTGPTTWNGTAWAPQ